MTVINRDSNRMKSTRHVVILELIAQKPIETQEELADELRAHGFQVTQATISRDIKELHLIKTTASEGKYRYAPAERVDNALNERFIRMFSDTVVSVASAYNQIIIKTITASANVAAEAIDSMNWHEILGSIAGENTILLIVRSVEDVQPVMDRLNALIHR